MKSGVVVLIVARPDRLRDSLGILLDAIPWIERVENVADGQSALDVFASSVPDLVLLDSNLPDDQTAVTLRQIKAGWPQTKCVVLADNVRQQQTARVQGADGTLLKGFPTTQLLVTLERLLSRNDRYGQSAPSAGVEYSQSPGAN